MADTILTALQSLALACEKEGEREPMTIIMPDRAFTALCRKLAPHDERRPVHVRGGCRIGLVSLRHCAHGAPKEGQEGEVMLTRALTAIRRACATGRDADQHRTKGQGSLPGMGA